MSRKQETHGEAVRGGLHGVRFPERVDLAKGSLCTKSSDSHKNEGARRREHIMQRSKVVSGGKSCVIAEEQSLQLTMKVYMSGPIYSDVF